MDTYAGVMTPAFAALIAICLALVGVAGIIVPVLPGSLSVLIALVVWAIWGGSTQSLVVGIIGAVLVVCGMLASAVLTQRRLGARQIPQWPIAISLVVGVVASFWIPVIGLPLGFIASLLLIEYARVKDLKAAWSTSVVAMKSVGTGMLLELAAALLAVTLLGASVFATLIL